MTTAEIPDYAFTRDGERFVIGPAGLRYTRADGSTALARDQPIPADIIAATVIDLHLAGWTPDPAPDPTP